jgi:hypothetical protein
MVDDQLATIAKANDATTTKAPSINAATCQIFIAYLSAIRHLHGQRRQSGR